MNKIYGGLSLAILIVVLIAAIPVVIFAWQSPDALRVSAVAGVLVALATLVLAAVSSLQIQETREQAQKVERASLRPLIVPALSFDNVNIQNNSQTKIVFDIQNAGNGLATNIWGLVFPIDESIGIPINQWVARLDNPLVAHTGSRLEFVRGSAFDKNQQIDGIPLAPKNVSPTSSPLDRHDRYVAQLTLTYTDVLILKHASFFYLTDKNQWVCFAVKDEIRNDLSDLNNEIEARFQREASKS